MAIDDPALTRILESLQGFKENLDLLQERSKTTGVTVASFEGRFTLFEERFASFDDKFAAFFIEYRETWGSLEEKLTATQAEQTRMRVEIMNCIDRLQEKVELVREDARVIWATADTAINRPRNDRRARHR